MAKKKAAKKVTAKPALGEVPPAPSGPPTEVINMANGKPVHVSVIEGKSLPGKNGKLVFVDTFPNQHLMTVEDAADNFALRTADNTALYSERGFGSPVPEGLEALDIVALIEES